ncbi:MAG TPA: hypothetical protein VJH67_00810 [Candidatus Paceibacterota bacterium]
MTNFTQLVNKFIDLGGAAIPLIVAIAFLLFVWGVAGFIRSTGSDTDMQKKKGILIWGVVGLFVIFTIWGIISFLRTEFEFGGGVIIPQLPERQ